MNKKSFICSTGRIWTLGLTDIKKRDIRTDGTKKQLIRHPQLFVGRLFYILMHILKILIISY